MDKKKLKNSWLTIPNLLSLLRLLLIPVYVRIYLNAKDEYDYFLAATILAISCLTDLIDGQIARRFNMVSTIGKILDPLADKATQFTLILCLTLNYTELRYLVILFLIKELFQLVAGIFSWKRGRMLKGALLTGKICTTVLFTSLILLVLLPQLSRNVISVITAVDMVFLLVSFLDYLSAYLFRQHLFDPISKDI